MSRIAAWIKEGEAISIGLTGSGRVKEAALFDLFRSAQLHKLVAERLGKPTTGLGFEDFDELMRQVQPYLDATHVAINNEGHYVVTGDNPLATLLRGHDSSGGLKAAIASFEQMLIPTYC